MLSNMSSDIRYAVRTLQRNPGFAVAAVAPVALGIGINTGVFSILNNVVWRPLPTPASTELVSIYQEFRGVKGRRVYGARSMFSVPEYRAYQQGTHTLSGLTAYSKPWTASLGGQSPQEVEGVAVTCNYFDVLQVRPVIGTGFTAANCDTPNAPAAVILSHRVWTRAFAADPDIVGHTVTLNGLDVAVVGVAPEGFEGIDITQAAFFAPIRLQAIFYSERGFHEDAHTSWLMLVGRRSPGSSIDQVRAELAVIANDIDRQQPGRTTRLIVAPATSLSLPIARTEFLGHAAVIMAAFALVLLMACANVANVLLARAMTRTREIAVRLAVGAGRGRVIRQLLTESMIIALVGGAAGSLLAWWSFQALLPSLLSSLPGTISQPRIDAHPDLTVLWFAIGLTMATALVCGIAPALRASKQDLHTVMKQDGAPSRGRTGAWLRGTLITIQVGVCMVLLISTGLLLRTLHAAESTDRGFDYRNVSVVSVDLRGPAYDHVRALAFQQRFTDELSALPGVQGIARVGKVPLSPGRMQATFRLPHQEEAQEVDVNGVSAEFFSVMGIPIVRGRTFTAAEVDGTARAVIVTEATARRYWPGQDPIGRTIVIPPGEAQLEIVGVVKDAHVSHVAQTESSYLYLPGAPRAQRRLAVLVRSQIDFAAFARSVGTLTGRLDPGLVVRVNRLEANLDYWRAGSRVIASLSGSLSLLALVLASVGIYGVVSCAVNRRLREVGIRMTLGAGARDVQRLILRDTLRPVVVGVSVGIAGAAAAAQVLRSVLFGVSPFDPVAFILAPLFLIAVSTAASLLPTRAALRMDPATTLRYE